MTQTQVRRQGLAGMRRLQKSEFSIAARHPAMNFGVGSGNWEVDLVGIVFASNRFIAKDKLEGLSFSTHRVVTQCFG
jgi:hypothetical protein